MLEDDRVPARRESSWKTKQATETTRKIPGRWQVSTKRAVDPYGQEDTGRTMNIAKKVHDGVKEDKVMMKEDVCGRT